MSQSMYAKLLAQSQQGGAAASSTPAPLPEADSLVVSPPAVKPLADGVLLVFGSTSWDEMGKKAGAQTEETPNLFGPHRLLAGLDGVKISFVCASGVSAHCIAVATGGEAYSWGRNADGQLAHGDKLTRHKPTRIKAFEGIPIKAASTGKAHTVFVTSDGSLRACGANKQGCAGAAGLKNKKSDCEPMPVAVPGAPPIVSIASGANFNLAVDEDGDVWAWGWSEFGVLGNGTDGQFNKSDSSIKLTYSPSATPTAVLKLKGKKTVQVACGAAHCVSVSADGTCYTWGSGGYGRLGHKDQADKWVPTELPEIKAKEVGAGLVHTFAIGYAVLRNGVVCKGQPSVYLWGRARSASQDPWMYPKPEDELRGWNVHCFGVGSTHNVVYADSSTISWGSSAICGELGFGVGGKKSSARPDKVNSLEGEVVAQVRCGLANTLMLVERSPTVDALPEWTPPEDATKAPAEPNGKASGKRKAEPPAAAKKGKAAAKKGKK